MIDPTCKVKCQLCPFELSYSHCLIRLNISNENNDLGYHRFEKSTFQKIPHSNAFGRKFDLDVK